MGRDDGKKTAEELSFEALDANGTPRQVAIARTEAMLAYLQEALVDLSRSPVRPLPDDEPHLFITEVAALWERFCGLRFQQLTPPSQKERIEEILEVIDDVALDILFDRRTPNEMQEGLGCRLRGRLIARGFESPKMTDRDIGEVVLLWPKRHGGDPDAPEHGGDPDAPEGRKWEAALRLVREAGCECHSWGGLEKRWRRRSFPKVTPEEHAASIMDIWRNGARMSGVEFDEKEAQRRADEIARVPPK
jgi:hypothetical protein